MIERLRHWYKGISAAPSVPDGHRFYALPRPDGSPFQFGVELVSDEVTPLPFVARALQEEAGLSEGDAYAACAIAQGKGGVLLPTASLEEAEGTAARLVARAQREAWPLQCKAVSLSTSSPPPSCTHGEA